MSGVEFPTSQDMYLRLRSAAGQSVPHASIEQAGSSVCHPLIVRFQELSQMMKAMRVTDPRKYDTNEWTDKLEEIQPKWATQESADWNLFSLLLSSEEPGSTPASPKTGSDMASQKIDASKS